MAGKKQPENKLSPTGMNFVSNEAVVAVLKPSVCRAAADAYCASLELKNSATSVTNQSGEDVASGRLYLGVVAFLRKALAVSRQCLYVVLPFQGPTSKRLYQDVMETALWKFAVWLGSVLEAESLHCGNGASPFVIPWVVDASELNSARDDRSTPPWLKKVRSAVAGHISVTSEEVSCEDVTYRAYSDRVVLAVDDAGKLTAVEALKFWRRHIHIGPIDEISDADFEALSTLSDKSVTPSGDCVPASPPPSEESRGFDFVIVAGTFDRLHAGHKALLTAAAFAAKLKIGIAVASGDLVSQKRSGGGGSEVDEDASRLLAPVQPFALRLQRAVAFLELVLEQRENEKITTGATQALCREEEVLLRKLEGRTYCCGHMAVFHETKDWSKEVLQYRGEVEAYTPETLWNKEVLRWFTDRSGMVDDICPAFASSRGTGPSTATPPGPLKLQIFRITDPVGPAGEVDFDCLVVSEETEEGAVRVNAIREKNGLRPVALLKVSLVDRRFPLLAEEDSVVGFQEKLSSTALRRWEVLRLAPRGISVDSLQMFRAMFFEAFVRFGLKCSEWGKREELNLDFNLFADLPVDDLTLVGLASGGKLIWPADFMWQQLCASHATPWRQVHTFEEMLRDVEDHVSETAASSWFMGEAEVSLMILVEALYSLSCSRVAVQRESHSRCIPCGVGFRSCTGDSSSLKRRIYNDVDWMYFTKALVNHFTKKFVEDFGCSVAPLCLDSRKYILLRLLRARREADFWRLPSDTHQGTNDYAATSSMLRGLGSERSQCSGCLRLFERLPDMERYLHHLQTRRLERLLGKDAGERSVRLQQLLEKLRKEYFFLSHDEFERLSRRVRLRVEAIEKGL